MQWLVSCSASGSLPGQLEIPENWLQSESLAKGWVRPSSVQHHPWNKTQQMLMHKVCKCFFLLYNSTFLEKI